VKKSFLVNRGIAALSWEDKNPSKYQSDPNFLKELKKSLEKIRKANGHSNKSTKLK